MIYAVIDTNVLVSALITHHADSATTKVVAHLLKGNFIPLYDGDIVAEYEEVLHRRQFKIQSDVIDSLISYIQEHGVETSRTPFPDVMPDEDDRVFYEIALAVEDSFLVTGNLRHYPTTPKVITPAQMIQLIEE